jgi:hypothetical protein
MLFPVDAFLEFRVMNNSRFGSRVRWPMLTSAFVATMLSLGFVSTTGAQDAKPQAGEKPVVAKGKGAKARKIVLQEILALKDANAIALEYVILSRTVDGQGNVQEAPVDPRTHTFHVGDSCRVEVKPQTDVFLYVVTQDPMGDRFVLFPRVGDNPIHVKAGEPVRLPGDGLQFGFEEPVGEEKLAVIATKEKLVNVKELLNLAFDKQATPGRITTTLNAKGRPTTTDLDKLLSKDADVKKQIGMAAISDGPDEDDGSFFEAATSPGNPEVIVSIHLRSGNRGDR